MNIAYYLGYTEAEVATIVGGDVEEDSLEGQVSLFLEVWQMPDCGPRTVTILQKLKFASKVPDSGRPLSSRKQGTEREKEYLIATIISQSFIQG